MSELTGHDPLRLLTRKRARGRCASVRELTLAPAPAPAPTRVKLESFCTKGAVIATFSIFITKEIFITRLTPHEVPYLPTSGKNFIVHLIPYSTGKSSFRE